VCVYIHERENAFTVLVLSNVRMIQSFVNNREIFILCAVHTPMVFVLLFLC